MDDKKSAYVICYVHKITGGAYQFQNIALKKDCTVINIAEKFDKKSLSKTVIARI